MGVTAGDIFCSQASRKRNGKKQESDPGTEGMCLGMCFGAAIRTAFGNNTGIGLSLGMLTGPVIGMYIHRK